MIRSMTGYGFAAAESPSLKAAVSIRSVNHRYLDVTVHLPRRLQSLDAEIKRAVQERIGRGRVELTVQATMLAEEAEVGVAARPLVAGLVRALRQIQTDHGLAGDVTLSDVARFPGALEVLEPPSDGREEPRAELLAVIGHALEGLERMRRVEGAHLETDLVSGLGAIESAIDRLEAVAREGQTARRESLVERVRALGQDAGLDEGRLYQEVVRLVDRSDVTEEVQRLRSHVSQTRSVLSVEGPSGKRLDFLAQEMAREANTMGSKASTAPMVQEVVGLKSEIERFREQVQNVE